MAPPVKSAQRVLELLEFFAEERRPAGVGVIAQALGWPQSSTSVLLKGLADTGFFDHDGRTGMYVPNVRIALATAWLQEHLYSEHNLLRLMESVLERTGHTVMIGTRRGVQVRYLHVLQATREGRFIAKTGSLRPLFRSAAGKVLLTTISEREMAMLLRKANALEADPAQRLAFDAVRREIAQVRRSGHAISLGTSMAGAAALAVLIPVARDREPMSLSVGGPLREIEAERDHLVAVLRHAVEPIRLASAG
ncbi:IclR family transcriptional regulator [Aquabacterium sp. J223]|uniref:IclR family transcriptional regulator n=1 Tax=Aquabacterium sp. J223 TaxID=2898431 RepID=UPI0021AE28CC|nr:helix-turn-helix domain-containing protein [Aquabacterium sp. J223]UUX95006.1 helix-turn-helix domain-containing protein [Aquabacterium sp. J223]